jgi:translation initiation factor IF-2
MSNFEKLRMTQHIGASYFPVETLNSFTSHMGNFKTGMKFPAINR